MGKINRVIGTMLLILASNVLWFGSMGIRHTLFGQGTDALAGGTEKEKNIENSTTAKFYKNCLSEQEQGYYDLLYQCLINREESVNLMGCTEEQLAKTYDAVLFDNPEIFWSNSYQFLVYSDQDPYIEVRPSYLYTGEEIAYKNSIIASKTEEFLAGIDKKASDFDKVKSVYEYLARNTVYDHNASNNQYIDSIFEGEASVCAGYSRATKYLLEKLGIPSINVIGEGTNEEGTDTHSWNIVELNETFFQVDTTWGDPVIQSKDGLKPEKLENYVFYGYLGCTDEEMFRDHKESPDYEYPACISAEYNYYVVYDRLFDTYDQKALADLLKKDQKKKELLSSVRFSDPEAYNRAKRELLQLAFDQGIANKGSSLYTDDDLQIVTILY